MSDGANTNTPGAKKSLAKYKRLIIGVVVLSALIWALRNLSIPDCATIQTYLESWGVWAPVLFIVIYVISTVAFIPGLLVTMMAGLAFGPWWGTLVVSIGSVTGATIAFLVARYIAREAVEGFLSKQSWFNKFKDSIEENGFNFVIFVRLVPLFPFNGLNYACGLVPLKLRDYVIGSALGMLPGTFAYVYLGATGCQLIDSVIQGKTSFSQFPDSVKRNLLIAIVLLAVLSLLPIFLKKLRKKKDPSTKA
jgi:uncharacterized membrane protein YdjX (TVP38/TMEM64 family)